MGLIRNRKIWIMAFVIVMVVAVGFVLTAAPASAKSKKMNLIKDKNITYYKSGLVKSVVYYDISVVKFKYDSKGKITVIKVYDGPFEPIGLREVFKFKYSKSKLKSIVKITYQDGEIVSKEDCELKVGKKNTIKKIKYYDPYSEANLILQCAYDSKGRVKKILETVDYLDSEPDVTKYVIKRNSKGYVKKLTEKWVTQGGSRTSTLKTKIKSGKVTDITWNPGGMKYKFKYQKKSIKKKYVKAVKAQQQEMLYLFIDWKFLSPPYYMIFKC